MFASRIARPPVKATFEQAGGPEVSHAPRVLSGAGPCSVGLHIRPKLWIGALDDPLEREADAVADQIMRMGSSPPSFSAASPQVSRERNVGEGEDLQVRPAGEATLVHQAPPIVRDVVGS